MNSPKAKSYPMTPENFGRLRQAVSLLPADSGLRFHTVEARNGLISFRLVLEEVARARRIHPNDPDIFVGTSSDPQSAMEIAIAKGMARIRAISKPVDHPIFRKN